MTINKENMEKWCAALEAQPERQCIGILRERTLDEAEKLIGTGRYCAAGIAVQVALDNGLDESYYGDKVSSGKSVWNAQNLAAYHIRKFYGLETDPLGHDPLIWLPDGFRYSVTRANDIGYTFWDIAQGLRKKYLKDDE